MERNRRIAKAYSRVPVLTISGSDDGFDGYKIGLNGFDNPMRDSLTKTVKSHIGKVSNKIIIMKNKRKKKNKRMKKKCCQLQLQIQFEFESASKVKKCVKSKEQRAAPGTH